MIDLKDYIRNFGIYSMTMDWRDVVEILIITILAYYMLKWMKTTRAWSLMKGLILIGLFLAFAYFFEMKTILWLTQNIVSFAVIALIVVLQPELRSALETLGKKTVLGTFLSRDGKEKAEMLSEQSINEIVKACTEMGKVRTGALIVIERRESLAKVEETGIAVDGAVSSQLLINIFEKNTPLHDGAVIIRDNRISAATCYLPLSDSEKISKDLGTRHRAGIGISEESDCVTVIVSEETGRISMAEDGNLERNLSGDELRRLLRKKVNHAEEQQEEEQKTGKKRWWE
ncbi:MAG: diadenylate cyclase CdaA [Lachnospiraceae bacterium]|nr:diadenylate cyclase CdaA [Lachnospiraceae bacterium]